MNISKQLALFIGMSVVSGCSPVSKSVPKFGGGEALAPSTTTPALLIHKDVVQNLAEAPSEEKNLEPEHIPIEDFTPEIEVPKPFFIPEEELQQMTMDDFMSTDEEEEEDSSKQLLTMIPSEKLEELLKNGKVELTMEEMPQNLELIFSRKFDTQVFFAQRENVKPSESKAALQKLSRQMVIILHANKHLALQDEERLAVKSFHLEIKNFDDVQKSLNKLELQTCALQIRELSDEEFAVKLKNKTAF